MANQLILGRALDANGYVAPAARATITQAGTATALDVFTDEAGTIAAANPIVADGNGFWPQRYVNAPARAVVTDADLATLYTLDPVPVSQSSASAANLIGFTPTVNIPENNVQDALETVDTNARTREAAIAVGRQPLDADLTAIAALSGTGLLAHTGAGTYAERTITSAGGTVAITNPGGVAGNINLEANSNWTLVETIDCTSGTTKDTASFVAGKTYKFVLQGVGHGDASSRSLQAAYYGDTAATFTTPNNISASTPATSFVYGEFELVAPKSSRNTFHLIGTRQSLATANNVDSANGFGASDGSMVNYGTAQTVDRLRFTWTGSVAFDAGNILVYSK